VKENNDEGSEGGTVHSRRDVKGRRTCQVEMPGDVSRRSRMDGRDEQGGRGGSRTQSDVEKKGVS